MSRNRRIKQIVNFYRIIIAYIIIITNKKGFKDFIYDEMYYWNKCCQLNLCNKIEILFILLIEVKEYRSLLIYRMRKKLDKIYFIENNISIIRFFIYYN